MLELSDVTVSYAGRPAVTGISLSISAGAVAALVGPNGAGKTSIVSAIVGLHRPAGGSVRLNGKDITRWPRHRRGAAGIALVPEGRRVFSSLTVLENLLVPRGGTHDRAQAVEAAFERFPDLKPNANRQAGLLSGGQQQMLSVARALMLDPAVLVLDEPTMGLAPFIVEEVMSVVRSVSADGAAVLLADESARKVVGVADDVYVIRAGRIVHELEGGEALSDAELVDSYFR